MSEARRDLLVFLDRRCLAGRTTWTFNDTLWAARKVRPDCNDDELAVLALAGFMTLIEEGRAIGVAWASDARTVQL